MFEHSLGCVSINKGGALQSWLIRQRDLGLQIPQRQRLVAPPSSTDGKETVVWWEAGGLGSNQSWAGICNSHQPSTENTLPAHPSDGRHTNLLWPPGNKDSHYNLFHFYVLLRNENQIKTKPGGALVLFHFPSSFLLPSFLLLLPCCFPLKC